MISKDDSNNDGRQDTNFEKGFAFHTLDLLQDWLKQRIAETLDLSLEDIESNRSLRQMGLESIQAISILSALDNALDQSLPPNLLRKNPTIAELSRDLFSCINTAGDDRVGTEYSYGPARCTYSFDSGSTSNNEPIAIVGMACRFPGGAVNPADFWQLLSTGTDAITEVPAGRWDAAAFYDSDRSKPGKMNSRWGGFIDQVDGFDPSFFGMTFNEARDMDPQQRLVLELCWEALEDGGIVPETLWGSRTAVYIGSLFHDYKVLQSRLGPEGVTAYTSTGSASSIIANRVSYLLGLQGASANVDTACSSALAAVSLGCRGLRAGRNTLAIIGGVNLMLAPDTTIGMSKLGALSPDGRCFAFDARANGYVRGEGGGILVLKTLSRARRDGDHIYCLIRGLGMNNDGASFGLTSPNPKAQIAVLEEACRDGDIEPGTIQYVEAHGSGTPVGDPYEAFSVGRVYGLHHPPDRPLYIGSVKTNIGHLEAGAGIAGIIKTALALYHRRLPPNLNFDKVNPKINLTSLNTRVVTELMPWPAEDEQHNPSRAGVNAFGYGGTNAHVILEGIPNRRTYLLPLESDAPEGLHARAQALRSYLDETPARVGAVCSAAASQLGEREQRLAVTGATRQELIAGLSAYLEQQPGEGWCATGRRAGASNARDAEDSDRNQATNPIFVFPCLGSQWTGMARDLLTEEPLFRATLERCDAALKKYVEWSLIEELWKGEKRSHLNDSNFLHIILPAISAVQIALTALWRSWGITPGVVVGHGTGEVAAAHAAGILDLDDAMRTIHHLSTLYRLTVAHGEGAMRLAGAPIEKVETLARDQGITLNKHIYSAGENTPESCLVGGRRRAIQALKKTLEGERIDCCSIGNLSSHVPLAEPFADGLAQDLARLAPRRARIPMFSTVRAAFVEGDELNQHYWRDNVCLPCRFGEAIQHTARAGHGTYIEVSPHATLLPDIKANCTQLGYLPLVLASQWRGEDGHRTMMRSLARLYIHGAEVSWERLQNGPRHFARSEPTGGSLPVPATDQPCSPDDDRRLFEEPVRENTDRHYLFPLSAKAPNALKDYCSRLIDVVDEDRAHSIHDMCYTASLKRSHFDYRLAVVASSPRELQDALVVYTEEKISDVRTASGKVIRDRSPKVAFVFSGQGSQWLGMGRELLEKESVFRDVIEDCDVFIRERAGWSLLEQLRADATAARLDQTDVLQPILVAFEIALARLWLSWGVRPHSVVGHSLGEIAAAHISGSLSLEHALEVALQRSRVMRRTVGGGAVALFGLDVKSARRWLAGFESKVSIAAVNSPQAVVLSGEPEAISELKARADSDGVFCRLVNSNGIAFHSPQMDPLAEELEQALSDLKPQLGHTRFYSTVTAANLPGKNLDAHYWARNLRETVQFNSALNTLLDDDHTLFVEISPHPVLAPVMEQVVTDRNGEVAISLRRNEDEQATMLASLGELYVRGCEIDWKQLFPEGGRLISLPTYPWQRERCWIEEPRNRSNSPVFRSGSDDHPLLGPAWTSSVPPTTRYWNLELSPEDLPNLTDCHFAEDVVLPDAAFLEMALAASKAAYGPDCHVLEDVSFHKDRLFAGSEVRELQLAFIESAPQLVTFQIASRVSPQQETTPSAWEVHVTGNLRVSHNGELKGTHSPSLEAIRQRCREAIPIENHDHSLAETGQPFDPVVCRVERLRRATGEALGRIELSESLTDKNGLYQIHPAVLDAALQTLAPALNLAKDGCALIPTGVRRFQVRQHPEGNVWSYAVAATLSDNGSAALEGDLYLLDESGQVLVEAIGVQCRYVEQRKHLQAANEDERYFAVDWEPLPPATALPIKTSRNGGGHWLIFADREGLGDEIQSRLEARGEHVITVIAADSATSESNGANRVDPTSPESMEHLFQQVFTKGVFCRGIVHLWSLDMAPVKETTLESLHRDQERGYGSLLHLVQAICRRNWRDQPRLWLVTRAAKGLDGEAVEPAQTPIWGLADTLAYEHPKLRCTRVDLDRGVAAGDVQDLFDEIMCDHQEDRVLLRGDGRFGARLVSRPLPLEVLAPAGESPIRLEIDEPGHPENLAIRIAPRRSPGPGEVELEVVAAGLNSQSFIRPKTLGFEPAASQVALGCECAGRIVNLGEGVEGFEIGQEVVVFFTPLCLGSYVIVSASFVIPIPSSITMTTAAGIPYAFSAAWYALYHIGRIHQRDRILIHAAAEDLGLAAVQLARRAKAEILATAETPEQRAYLRDLGIEHVMDSGSIDFADEVMAATSGRGVDIVFNTLSGEAIEKSLSVLTEGGHFLELGKQDIDAERPLSMKHFQKPISYTSIDLSRLAKNRPARFSELFHEVMNGFESYGLEPLPTRLYSLSKAKDAAAALAGGQHTGKLVLCLQDPTIKVSVAPDEAELFRPDSTYLISGGLGRLGLDAARWIVESGARHLILLDRMEPTTPEQGETLAVLTASGAQVLTRCVDISQRPQVAQALQEIEQQMPPLRGILHAAEDCSHDGPLLQQDLASFKSVFAPKIDGAWNLHELTRRVPLGFFVLFSSATSLLGAPSRGGCTTANTFLDALAQYRRSQGMPALSINWDDLMGTEAAEERPVERTEPHEHIDNHSPQSRTARNGTTHLDRLWGLDLSTVAPIALNARQWIDLYPQTARSPLLSRLLEEPPKAPTAQQSGSNIKETLTATPPAERRALLEGFVRKQAAQILRIDPERVERTTPFMSLGFDSMMGLKFRNHLENELSLGLKANLVWVYPTVSALAGFLEITLCASDEDDSDRALIEPEEEHDHIDERDASAGTTQARSVRSVSSLLERVRNKMQEVEEF